MIARLSGGDVRMTPTRSGTGWAIQDEAGAPLCRPGGPLQDDADASPYWRGQTIQDDAGASLCRRRQATTLAIAAGRTAAIATAVTGDRAATVSQAQMIE